MEGLLLTRLGASLVYRLAAWQGYLGTSVGFLFDLFGRLPATCLGASLCAGARAGWAAGLLKAVIGLFGHLCRVAF